MRFALFTLSMAVASTSASILGRQSLPNCAATCITNADLSGCQPTDTSCLCHSNAFVSSTTNCIESSCSGSDLNSAIAAAVSLCEAVGVTLSSTATSASSTATSPASTTSGAASAASSASSAASSAVSAASSAASSATSSAAAAATSTNAAISNTFPTGTFASLAALFGFALVL